MVSKKLVYNLQAEEVQRELVLVCEHLYIVGYSGRNQSLVRQHIQELKLQLNVDPPVNVPEIYEIDLELLTFEHTIDKGNGMGSGEAEYVIICDEGNIYIGVGSDHTDRSMEKIDVQLAKNACQKPMGNTVWPYAEVKDIWDNLNLKSSQYVNSEHIPYQDGSVSSILSVEDILEILKERGKDIEHCVIFSGTVPLLDKYCFGERFEAQLLDHGRHRALSMYYDIK